VAAREEEGVEARGVDVGPGEGGAEATVLLQLAVEGLGLGVGAELAEDHAGEEQRVRRRAGAALGGEDHLVPAAGEQAPGYGDLGDVEVPVREGDQDAHQSPSFPAPTNQSSRRPKSTLKVVSDP